MIGVAHKHAIAALARAHRAGHALSVDTFEAAVRALTSDQTVVRGVTGATGDDFLLAVAAAWRETFGEDALCVAPTDEGVARLASLGLARTARIPDDHDDSLMMIIVDQGEKVRKSELKWVRAGYPNAVIVVLHEGVDGSDPFPGDDVELPGVATTPPVEIKDGVARMTRADALLVLAEHEFSSWTDDDVAAAAGNILRNRDGKRVEVVITEATGAG